MRMEAENFFNLLLRNHDKENMMYILVNSEFVGENKFSINTFELSDMNRTWLTNLTTSVDASVHFTIINSGNLCFAMEDHYYSDFFETVSKIKVTSTDSDEIFLSSKINKITLSDSLSLTNLKIK